MSRILIPVDASNPARTTAAVAEALRIHAREPVSVYLLNVQPLVNGHVAMFFDSDELDELRLRAGEEDLAPARALLDAHNMSFKSTVKIGRSAETIASTARELGCDSIVMGDDRSSRLATRMFGSLAQQVRQLLGVSSNCQVIGP